MPKFQLVFICRSFVITCSYNSLYLIFNFSQVSVDQTQVAAEPVRQGEAGREERQSTTLRSKAARGEEAEGAAELPCPAP